MSSVKVAVRVRPFNSREVQRNCKLAIEMRNTQTIISGGPKARRSFSLFLFHLSLLPPLSFPRSPHMILSDCLTYQMPSYFFYFLFDCRGSKIPLRSTILTGHLTVVMLTLCRRNRCTMTLARRCWITPLRVTIHVSLRMGRQVLARVTR